MPAVLTHKSIMLLARERLGVIRDRLRAKLASGRNVSDLEHRVLFLAGNAHAMLSTPPHPSTTLPGMPYIEPLGEGVSKFAVMGSMGPDIPAFAAIVKPGQAWVFDTVHKGYPDSHREAVVAGTCELALAIWRRSAAAIAAEVSDARDRRRALDASRAYVLGHLCHVAADVISHPFINDLEWHQGFRGREKFSHSGGEGSLDARVARQVLLRGGTREGEAWDAWWPTLDEVPSQFFAAYAEALEDVYAARSRRPTGLAEFEAHLGALDPPALEPQFLRDGYSLYRSGIVSMGYGYGYWSWWGALTPLMLPLLVLPVVVAALPHAGQLFRAPLPEAHPERDPERAWFELLTAPLVVGSLVPTVYGIWLAALTTRGVETRTGFGIASAVAGLILAIVFFATLGRDTPALPRWLLMFGIPALAAAVWLVLGSVDLGAEGRAIRGAQSLIYALPLLVLGAFLLFYLIFFLGPTQAGEVDMGLDSPLFWVFTGLWMIGVLVAWFLLPRDARDARIPEHPDSFSADRPHHVRLFDDATLYADPTLGAAFTGLARRFYPAGRRELLRLWWEGDGELHVRVDRHQLVFNFVAGDTATRQVVPAPVAPITLAEYARYLRRTVRDAGGSTGRLGAAVVHPTDPDYELPTGATFADHGDDEDTLEAHDEAAPVFRKLGESQDDSDYILYHAPKAHQAVRFARRGPVADPFALDEASLPAREADGGSDPGFLYVHDPAGQGSGETIMDHAADLAALLCMGASSHLREDLTVGSLTARGLSAADATVNRVHQVFRNWNLDRRRVNEWRMLVTGGAASEKGGAPERADPAMLRPLDPDAWRSALTGAALAEGEATARQLGWVPLLRAWLDMARRPAVDPLADTALDPANPVNRALGRGLAFVLDMPDPRRVP